MQPSTDRPRRVSPIAIQTAALLAGCCLPALTSDPASAADYVAQPIAQEVQLNQPVKTRDSGLTAQGILMEETSFDSNPLLLTSGNRSLYGSTTQPELLIQDITPDLSANIDTMVDGNVFNQSNFDSVDVHSKAGFLTGNQTWSFGASENLDYDTTRTSELSSFGLTTEPFRHTGFNIAPQVSYSPTPIDKITLYGGFDTSSYANTIFSDYKVYSATPTYVHNFDPTNAGIFALQVQRYETTDNAKDITDNAGPQVGWITALTPELTAKATVGAQETRKQEAGLSTSWSLDTTFSGEVVYNGEQDMVDVIASRSEYPMGNGQEALLTSIQLNGQHRLNKVLGFDYGAVAQSSTYQTAVTGDLKDQWGGSAGLTYSINRLIDVTASYAYRYETLENIPGHADDNLVTLSLTYRLTPRSL